jgi:hypothetical protein
MKKIFLFFGVYYFVKFTSATKTKIGSGYCGRPDENGILVSLFG